MVISFPAVFEILNGHLIPWVILQDGDGRVDKGFKGEWMTVKNKRLYIGSIGKVWTSQAGVSAVVCVCVDIIIARVFVLGALCIDTSSLS